MKTQKSLLILMSMVVIQNSAVAGDATEVSIAKPEKVNLEVCNTEVSLDRKDAFTGSDILEQTAVSGTKAAAAAGLLLLAAKKSKGTVLAETSQALAAAEAKGVKEGGKAAVHAIYRRLIALKMQEFNRSPYIQKIRAEIATITVAKNGLEREIKAAEEAIQELNANIASKIVSASDSAPLIKQLNSKVEGLQKKLFEVKGVIGDKTQSLAMAAENMKQRVLKIVEVANAPVAATGEKAAANVVHASGKFLKACGKVAEVAVAAGLVYDVYLSGKAWTQNADPGYSVGAHALVDAFSSSKEAVAQEAE